MSFVDERKALTREKRVSSLSHFNGTLETLLDETHGAEIKQRIRTLSQVSYDEILYAIQILSRIKDAAVVVHGAIGCSASGLYYNEQSPFFWYSTNLNERDTILGGDEKLRKAVKRAYDERNPKAIFVVGTPVVAINNDDVNSMILELEDELDVKIISIYTDGFKSKAPTTGYDIVTHSLLRYVVDRDSGASAEKEDFVNVISFSENRENLVSVLGILRDLGISYNLIPQFSGIDNIAKAGKARATIALNPEEGSYFAQELEEVLGVPYIRTDVPIGLHRIKKFISKLAKEFGIEEKAKAYIEQQEAALERVSKSQILSGKSVFLDVTLEEAAGFSECIETLGGTLEGLAIPYVDLENKDKLKKLEGVKPSLPIIIGNGQLFEKANVLSKKSIDYYISGQSNLAFAAEQGSIPVSIAYTASYGYEGVRQLTKAIAKAKQFHILPEAALYKGSWLKKSSNWYVKQEVK
jgi:nitrogenase molybdenum-iron protein alpha chain